MNILTKKIYIKEPPQTVSPHLSVEQLFWKYYKNVKHIHQKNEYLCSFKNQNDCTNFIFGLKKS